MKITNNYNLPEPLVAAISNDAYRRVGDISVTELIGPPQIRYLRKLHEGEIEEDASDRIWALLGQAVHIILERAALKESLVEERLTAQIGGWTISGKPDLWSEPGILTDYKITSVWSYLLGDKLDWEHQLNAYAWLYRQAGFPVAKIQNVLILRDWQTSRQNDTDYPPCQAITWEAPLWKDADITQYLDTRVALHQAADAFGPIPCSDEERWHKPDTWAIVFPGRKTAWRVLPTKEAADRLATKTRNCHINHRPGADRRCKEYCNVAQWCDQGRPSWENIKWKSPLK